MKRIPAIIAWVGVAVMLAASLPTFYISWWWLTRPETAGRVTEGVIVSVALGVLGLFPALIGGLLAKSRRVSWGIIIAGGIYILAFVPWMLVGTNEWIMALPPGVLCLTGGSALMVARHRGWWFTAAFILPFAAFTGFMILPFVNAPDTDFQVIYEAIEIKSVEIGSGEVNLNTGPYRLVTTEPDGYIWEYLRVVANVRSIGDIRVGPPPGGKILFLYGTRGVPLEKVSVPDVAVPASASSRNDSYSEGWIGFTLDPGNTWVTISGRGDVVRYIIFRIDEYISGEHMIIEYRHAKPALP